MTKQDFLPGYQFLSKHKIKNPLTVSGSGLSRKAKNVGNVYVGGPPIPEMERIHMLHIIIERSDLILRFPKLMSFFIGLLASSKNDFFVFRVHL